MANLTKKERLQKRSAALKAERTQWETAWKAISRQLLPYGEVIHSVLERRNKGDRRDERILNSRPVLALKVLVAGLMAGITSPARQWFKLGLKNEHLLEQSKEARVYLEQVQREIEAALARSNFYKVLSSQIYPALATICTAAMFEEEGDEPGTIHFTAMPVGEYYIDVNKEGAIDVVFRELALTVRQVVKRFGIDNPGLSEQVRQAWDDGNLNQAVTVWHAVLPNDEYRPGMLGALGKKYVSVWWQPACENKDALLREEGYHEFPCMIPRWSSMATEAYGHGPGFDVLGDCQMLQHYEKRRLNTIDKIVNPPLEVADNIRKASLVPGDITYVPGGGQGTGVKTIHTVPPETIRIVQDVVDRLEARVSEGLFAHLWSMVMNDQRNQRATATEIEAQRQEVMLQLGPLLENLNDELLEPVIERTFAILDRNDFLPVPPPELEGEEIKIEFISIMHQMQKSTGLASIRTLVGEFQAIAQLRPDILDKLEVDQMADELRRITGVSSELLLSNEEVAKKRGEREQQAAAQQQGEAMATAAGAMKDFSQADPEKLQELARTMSPAAAAQGGALETLPQ